MKLLARLVLLVAAAAVGGCSGPKTPPPSSFYSAVDLQAIVKQSAPQGLKWGGHGSGETSSSKSFNGDFQAQQDSLDTFLQALKVELQKAVEAHGGRVATSVILSKDELPKALARRGVKRSRDGKELNLVGLSGFQLNYHYSALFVKFAVWYRVLCFVVGGLRSHC